MNGDLGHKEIREFIASLKGDYAKYLETEDVFMDYYNSNKTFYQANVYDRLNGGYAKNQLLVVKPGMTVSLETEVLRINNAIENFIKQLADTDVVGYEKNTFLYYNRVPNDWGIDLSILERNKVEEEKPEIYRCDKCNKVFLQPYVRTENIGFKEHPYYENEALSPCCKYEFSIIDDATDEEIKTAEEELKAQNEAEELYAMMSYYEGR